MTTLAEDLVLLRARRRSLLFGEMDLCVAVGAGLLAELVLAGSVHLPDGAYRPTGPCVVVHSPPAAAELGDAWRWINANRLSGYRTVVGLGVCLRDSVLDEMVRQRIVRPVAMASGQAGWQISERRLKRELCRDVDRALGDPDAAAREVLRAALAGTVSLVNGRVGGSRRRAASARARGRLLDPALLPAQGAVRLLEVARTVVAFPERIREGLDAT